MSITTLSDSVVRLWAIVMGAASLAGCGSGADVQFSADSNDDDTARRGEALSYACQACHTLGRNGGHQIGPNLWGVFGRAAGTVPGFDFSPALENSGLVWSPDALDDWLSDPTGFMPGTTMAFTGYRAAQDREALIRYLEAVTAEPAASR